ncbi:peptidase A1 family protein [Pleurotus pulmonarius]
MFVHKFPLVCVEQLGTRRGPTLSYVCLTLASLQPRSTSVLGPPRRSFHAEKQPLDAALARRMLASAAAHTARLVNTVKLFKRNSFHCTVPLSRRKVSRRDPRVLSRSDDGPEHDYQHAVGVSDFKDNIYSIVMNIGGQDLSVSIDTGSADSWFYDPQGSIHTVNTTTVNATIAYDKGSVLGPIYFATAELAGLSIPSQAYIHATEVVELKMFDAGCSGLLGLSFGPGLWSLENQLQFGLGNSSTLKAPPVVPNILQLYPSLPSFFTVYLGRSDDPNAPADGAGAFTLGEYVEGLESIADAVKVPGVSDYFWEVLVDGITVGDSTIPLNSSVPTDKAEGTAVAILDTGYSIPQMPPHVVDAMYSSIPGAVPVEDITVFQAGGMSVSWFVPCNATPAISFKIGGVDFPIHPADLIRPLRVDTDGIAFCFNLFQKSTTVSEKLGSDMILGDAFLRNAYVSFNYGERNDSGHFNQSFMQLLPLTDLEQARQDLPAIRAKQLEGLTVLSPAEARSLLLPPKANTSDVTEEPNVTEKPPVSGLLASSDDDGANDTVAARLLNRYTPAIIGLLAANLLALLILCGLGVYMCIVRNGKSTTTKATTYQPVKAKEEGNPTEFVYPSLYDPPSM